MRSRIEFTLHAVVLVIALGLLVNGDTVGAVLLLGLVAAFFVASRQR